MELSVVNKDDQVRAKLLKRYKCLSICGAVTGVVLIVTCCFTPKLMDNLIDSNAKSQTQLTQVNEPNWRGIPGTYDIRLMWDMYFYNTTNALEVSDPARVADPPCC